jgi:hypothetical protein
MFFSAEESVSRVEIDLVFRTFADEGILVYADGGRQMTSSGKYFSQPFVLVTRIKIT